MKSELINANALVPVDPGAKVSFRLFIDFLKEKMLSTGADQRYCSYVLDRFHERPGASVEWRLDEVKAFSDLLELIATCVIPVIENRDEVIWAFGKTLSPYVFFASEAFYRLHAGINVQGNARGPVELEEALRRTRVMQQNSIMANRNSGNKSVADEWVHRLVHPMTGLYQYYRLLTDLRFAWLDEKPASPGETDSDTDDLPGDFDEGKGFTILSVIDVTARESLAQLDRVSVDEDGGNITQVIEEINLLLQTIIGDQRFRFGIFPFLSVDLRPAIMYDENIFSIIATACRKSGVAADDFGSFIEEWHQTLDIKTFQRDYPDNKLPPAIRDAIEKAGISFLIGIPASYQQNRTGLLEISSLEDGVVLSDAQLNLLQPALQIVGRLLRQFIDRFNARIEHIVKEKFTNIQQAVEWKFKVAAWHFLSKNLNRTNIQEIEQVGFADVYPFYGAVDIRNSTLARNEALRQDLIVHLRLLRELIAEAAVLSAETVATKLAVDDWTARCDDALTSNDETDLDRFLGKDLLPFLETLENQSVRGKLLIGEYRRATDENLGIAYKRRQGINVSMQTINGAIDGFYDIARRRLQKIHPCYFEKFRTDGVEYDIYAGQSMAPHLLFSKEQLQSIHHWQLESMIDITRLTDDLRDKIPISLETTQLLFAHAGKIDISFRSDERKFDVEGAYNIRYQMVKKRIDKVRIKGTNERLTRPGTIAIVYSLPADVEDYIACIATMQKRNLLQSDLQFYELEELQGVSGLQALRVGVTIPVCS